MTDAEADWTRVTDDELEQAADAFDKYATGDQVAICAEFTRRGMEPVDRYGEPLVAGGPPSSDGAGGQAEENVPADPKPQCPYCEMPIGLREDHDECGSCGRAFADDFRRHIREWASEDEENTAVATSVLLAPPAAPRHLGTARVQHPALSCPRCSHALASAAVKFCAKCGTDLRIDAAGAEGRVALSSECCPACGTSVNQDAVSCDSCGLALVLDEPPETAFPPPREDADSTHDIGDERPLEGWSVDACPACGSALADNALSCPACGLALEPADE